MFVRDSDQWVSPERTLENIKTVLEFVKEQNLSEEELYFVVKLILAMFD